jgi:hypothetical protein
MRPYLFALLFAAGSLAAQTNVLSSAPASSATNAPAPAAPAASRPSATIHIETSDAVQAPGASLDSPALVATGAPRTAILKKLQQRAAEDQAVSAGVNELGDQLSQLEPTGQFVERYVRIPARAAGEDPKVIRFYIPVFRMRTTH